MGELASLRLFLPVTGSLLAHLPVLRFDWLQSFKRPIDGGATFRGRRLLGDNKTWRGALAMSAGTFAATLALSRWPWYWEGLPAEVRGLGPIALGALLGAGTVLAELPGSFVKRQLGIAPGAQRRSASGALISFWDQGDFVVGISVLLAPVWVMPPRHVLSCFCAVAAAHLALSAIGYALGVRRTIL